MSTSGGFKRIARPLAFATTCEWSPGAGRRSQHTSNRERTPTGHGGAALRSPGPSGTAPQADLRAVRRHPIAVAACSPTPASTAPILTAAYLHDVVEKTTVESMSPRPVRGRGRRLVDALSDDPDRGYAPRKRALRGRCWPPAGDAVLIYAADRSRTCATGGSVTPERRESRQRLGTAPRGAPRALERGPRGADAYDPRASFPGRDRDRAARAAAATRRALRSAARPAGAPVERQQPRGEKKSPITPVKTRPASR